MRDRKADIGCSALHCLLTTGVFNLQNRKASNEKNLIEGPTGIYSWFDAPGLMQFNDV